MANFGAAPLAPRRRLPYKFSARGRPEHPPVENAQTCAVVDEVAPSPSSRPSSQWGCLEKMRALGLKTNPEARRFGSADDAVFVEYCRWLRTLFFNLGFPDDDAATTVSLMAEAVASRVPPDGSPEFDSSDRKLLVALDRSSKSVTTRRRQPPEGVVGVLHRTAADVLSRLFDARSGVLTTQVLSEFFVSVTREITAPLDMKTAAERVHNYVLSWPVLDVTPLVVLEATRGAADHQLHYRDAQLWAAARLNQIDLILTEDLPSGQVLECVRFMDPFGPGFSLNV